MKRTLLTFTAITSMLLPLATPVVATAQDSAVQRRVERAQRQLDRDTAREQRSEPRREESRRQEPRRQEQRSQEQRPQPQRSPEARTPDQRNNSRPQYRTEDRSGQRPEYRGQDRRNQSPVQRRVEEAQRQLDRANGVRPDQRDRDRDRDRRNDTRRWDSNNNRPRANRQDRRDNYRDFQRRWNSDQWRRDFNRDRRSDWWRNDNRFRSWSGMRVGFYFAPGYGYYSVPRSYWNRHWQVGQYLPDVFWRYQVNDYRTYGLGYPPVGTRWVYVDNSIYLIDEYDGYIVEVIRDAWRW
ncbi:RcnB family protein [Brevundimonas sp. GN22]